MQTTLSSKGMNSGNFWKRVIWRWPKLLLIGLKISSNQLLNRQLSITPSAKINLSDLQSRGLHLCFIELLVWLDSSKNYTESTNNNHIKWPFDALFKAAFLLICQACLSGRHKTKLPPCPPQSQIYTTNHAR